jgi:hypothetical protein
LLHIFIDESGDFGFKKGSENIIVACLITNDYARIKNLMRRERNKRPRRDRKLAELKASKSNEMHRKFVLKNLAELDITINYSRFQTGKQIDRYWEGNEGLLYAVMVKDMLAGIVPFNDNDLRIILDRRHLQGFTHEFFNAYLIQELKKMNPSGIKYDVLHMRSELSPGLMAVDYVSHALYQYFEHGDASYMAIIEGLICHKK